MEAIPEDPSRIHFFKVLEMLARNNAVDSTQIRLKPPNSLIFGYSFQGLTLMRFVQYRLQFSRVERLEDAIQALDLYTSDARDSLPMFIIKTSSGKEFLRTRDDLANVVTRLLKRSRKHYSEEFIAQPFVISRGRKAMVVEVEWDIAKGVALVLSQNSTDLLPNAVNTLTTSAASESLLAKTSQSTVHLIDTLDLVRLVIDKAVLQEDTAHVRHLRIRMIQDIYQNWFFLGIEKFIVARSAPKRVKTLRIETESPRLFMTGESSASKVMSPTAAQTARSAISPRPPLFSPPASASARKRPISSKSATFLTSSRPQTAQTTVHLPREYLKQQELEAEVSKLIASESTRSIANMTYKSWKRRTEHSDHIQFIDDLYAKTICKQRHLVQKEAKTTLRNLQKFREAIKSHTDEMVFQAEFAERVAAKSVEVAVDPDLQQMGKLTKLRQEKMENDFRMQLERDGVAKIFRDSVEKFSILTASLRRQRAKRKAEMEAAAPS